MPQPFLSFAAEFEITSAHELPPHAMNVSPLKRSLTDELRESTVASNMQKSGLPDELATRLMNIGARVRKSVTEGFPSTTPTPYPSPVKGAQVFNSYPNPFSNNLFVSFASNVIPSAPTHSYLPGKSSRKRPREEDADADIKLRLRRPEHTSDNSTDEDSDSDDDLDIITCSSDSDKTFDRPIRPLRKSSCNPRVLSGFSALNPDPFTASSRVGFYTMLPSKDIQTEDEIMTILE